ncbi:MAG: zinc ribbon domain-containing protein [Candidatus Marinimicrobia bacterium]|nr:zinc ribbon domain-containing protein [Candidatus Neomarinimicrobiota bacterium]
MPTYDYQCSNCGFRFEEFQNIFADPIKKCPDCKKNKVIRIISGGAGLIFKGSGFYITDYKNKKPTETKSAETKSTDKKPKKKETAKSSAEKKD